jgi:hypothetical protein
MAEYTQFFETLVGGLLAFGVIALLVAACLAAWTRRQK